MRLSLRYEPLVGPAAPFSAASTGSISNARSQPAPAPKRKIAKTMASSVAIPPSEVLRRHSETVRAAQADDERCRGIAGLWTGTFPQSPDVGFVDAQRLSHLTHICI